MSYDTDDKHDDDPDDIIDRLRAKQRFLIDFAHDPCIRDAAALLGEAAKSIKYLRETLEAYGR